MNELEKARKEIEAIDSQMASLYEQRMDAVRHVISYKMENNLPVYDKQREKNSLRKIANI